MPSNQNSKENQYSPLVLELMKEARENSKRYKTAKELHADIFRDDSD